jgi:Fur family ferric uptake transcriptional regulator
MRPTINADCERCQVPISDGGEIIQRLQLAGHLVTPPRAAVVRAIAAQPRPFTASQLCAAVAERSPSIGRATIFRTLELLEQEGILDRLHSLKGDASYVTRDPQRPRRHHYLVCAACDGVTEVEDPRLDTLLHSVAARHAFRAEGHLVEIFGRCPEC